MNKPTMTALYGLLVILVFFGISSSIQACGGKKKSEDPTEEDLSSRAAAVADEYSDDDIFEDDEETGDSYQSGTEASPAYDDETDDRSDTPIPERPARTSSGAPHMIVAGNYLLEDNADKMIRDLKRKGFTSAEKVVFDLSQYYTVVAGRYRDRGEANRRAAELKRSGIDNYVITQK